MDTITSLPAKQLVTILKAAEWTPPDRQLSRGGLCSTAAEWQTFLKPFSISTYLDAGRMLLSQAFRPTSIGRLAALRRLLPTTTMQAQQHLYRTAFISPLPFHSTFLGSSPPLCTRTLHHVTPRRPRARLVPALQMQPSDAVANEQKLPSKSARTLVNMPETGEDGLPIIEEDDIEEQFVRGSGPGGQKINKTASCVVLKHVPTGVTVKCQESRSQTKNRQLARKILQKKLDEIIRGEESQAARELSRARARKAKRRRKSIKKHFKSRRDKAIMDSRMADY